MTLRTTRHPESDQPDPASIEAQLGQQFGPPPSETHQDLLAAQRGDREALAALWRQHEARLRYVLDVAARTLSGALRSRLSCDELLQDAFVRVQENVARFEYRGRGSLAAWLLRIVQNGFRNWREQQLRRATVELPSPDGGSHSGSPVLAARAGSGGPATQAARNELRELVTEALARIRVRDEAAFEILYLLYFVGLELKEVHAALAASKTYDAFRMHEVKRAHRLLREAFAVVGLGSPSPDQGHGTPGGSAGGR